jgi:succinate dehydrogenase / fumarate reductase cytochrome b subunit
MSASSATSTAGIPIHEALCRWVFSSIGKKTIVAVTGILLVLFVTGHMLGNFTIYFGPDLINAYAKHLRDLGPFLWVIRLGLLATVFLHIFFTMLLWKENAVARPQKYAVGDPIKTTVFARTMRLTGLIVLAFIIFHLGHFTLLIFNPSWAHLDTELHGETVHDVYRMVVLGFSNPIVSAFYIISLGLLAFHLSHGIGSLFQTLGVTSRKMRPVYEAIARVYAWALFVGYSSIPISILIFGLGKNTIK